jgi:hypothetical protein
VSQGATINLYRAGANLMDLGLRYKVVIDGQDAGGIGSRQFRVFRVYSGEHSLYVTFFRIRWSQVLDFSVTTGEEADFTCHTSWLGFPTLRAVTPQDRVEIEKHSVERMEPTILSQDR